MTILPRPCVEKIGASEGSCTLNILLGRQALCWLSHRRMVDRKGIAPSALCLQGSVAAMEHAGPKKRWSTPTVSHRAKTLFCGQPGSLAPSTCIENKLVEPAGFAPAQTT